MLSIVLRLSLRRISLYVYIVPSSDIVMKCNWIDTNNTLSKCITEYAARLNDFLVNIADLKMVIFYVSAVESKLYC